MSEQISNNKWKSLAKRLSGLIQVNEETPEKVYKSLKSICQAQSEFFTPLFQKNPSGLIKLTYYIYSLLKTGNFELGDKILPNLGYACVLVTDNEDHYESCDNCDGDGYRNCSDCEGTGNVECSNCEGSGIESCDECGGKSMIECDNCDGSGEDEEGNTCSQCGGEGDIDCPTCKGEGEVTCTVCDGDEQVTCYECGGNGTEDCYSCGGSGEQSTDQIKYEKFHICTHNKNIKERCELEVNTKNPISKYYDESDEFWKNVVTLTMFEDNAEALEELGSGDVYCYYYNNDAHLALKRDMSIEIYGDDEDFYFDV